MKYKEKKRDLDLIFLQVIVKEDDKKGNNSEPILEKIRP
jgi:hypothetical protein